MDALAELREYLSKIEGGEEALAAQERELTGKSRPPRETETAREIREEDRLMHLQRAGRIKVGTGKLPDGFWGLPRPDDPDSSVRRALQEDRG